MQRKRRIKDKRKITREDPRTTRAERRMERLARMITNPRSL